MRGAAQRARYLLAGRERAYTLQEGLRGPQLLHVAVTVLALRVGTVPMGLGSGHAYSWSFDTAQTAGHYNQHSMLMRSLAPGAPCGKVQDVSPRCVLCCGKT